MTLTDKVLSKLFSLAKRHHFIKVLSKPVYQYLAKIRLRIRNFGKNKVVFSPVSEFWTSSEKWAESAGNTQNRPHFIKIDQSETIQRNLPGTIDKTVHWKFRQNLKRELPGTFLVKIPEGRVTGQGYVINSRNELLGDLSKVIHKADYLTDYSSHPVLKSELPPVERINGKVAVLSVPFAGTNYYHWMMDLLPRLKLIEKGGVSLDSIDYFVVNDNVSRFQQETLRHLGISRGKVLVSQWHPHIQATELIVPSFPCDTGNFAEWQCNWLREVFAPKEKAEPFRRLYLNRRKVSYRKILNEQAIEDLLIPMGFESIDPANYSILEQARMFSEAEIIIAPHGAALTNLVFCQPHTKVIELLHHSAVNLMFWAISEAVGLDYHYLLAEGERPADEVDLYENFVNLRFSTEDLSKMLTRHNIL